jgi:SAM-dependent methyltransferase
VEAARNLEGWQLDFEPEPLEAGPPWSYEEIAAETCAAARSALDLGTGGGEVLSRILEPAACLAFATEWWSRNAPVAARRLGERARVVRASSLSLPFAPGAFDLVLARHEEIDPDEVDRVLAAGGTFLTQQMVPDLWHELRAVFPDMTRYPDHEVEYPRAFEQAGLVVEELLVFRRPVRFRKLGHLVYHLLAAPWTVPGFSVESHADELGRLDEQARSRRGLLVTEGVYLLRVRKPRC